MPLTKLTCDTLGDLDGGLARGVINQALALALHDLDDRGADDKPRRVVITVELHKVSDSGDVAAHVDTAIKCPAWRTHGTIGKITREGSRSNLFFSPGSPANPDQKTFEDLESGD